MKLHAGRFPKYRNQLENIWCQQREGYRLEYTEWLKIGNAYGNIAHDSSLSLLGFLDEST